MTRMPYKLILLSTVLISMMLPSCARKVVIESDHRHPHIHHRHPHERVVQEHVDVNIR